MNGILYYDPDCGFCTRSAQWLARRMPPGSVRRLPKDPSELGIDPARATREIPFVSQHGATYGADAIAAALRLSRGWTRPAGHLLALPILRTLAVWSYRLVARNRHRLPGGTDACQLD